LFEFSSIEQYHAQLQEGKTSCVQAVEYYLERIRSLSHLNAFIEVYADEALDRARELDQKRNTGIPTAPLHGVIIALKDVICYKDHRVSASSSILRVFQSLYSATAVERLLFAEAIIIGNCNCDEFAMGSSNENSFYGPVSNALDETRVPGGSSGGSAVAVQAGLCMAALGSDTGGSVRQPADFCGIIGFKPGYGTISRYGLIAYASSFDQIGIFANNIADIKLLLETMSGPDNYDSTVNRRQPGSLQEKNEDQQKYRFTFFPEAIDHPALDPEIRDTIKNYFDDLKKQGHSVERVTFEWLDHIVPAYYVLTTAEASSNLARYDGIRYGSVSGSAEAQLTEFYTQNRSKGFGKEVKRRIMLGSFVLSSGYYDAYYTRAQKVRGLISDKLKNIFSHSDFIILPVSPTIAFKKGEKMKDQLSMYLADIYTVMANLAGIPAIALPLFKHSTGMPFGLQVMANHFEELPLLLVSNSLLEPASENLLSQE
jgi:aspartyl-tRNA(Asn)/glutamyl-tRNA(Gln) amidotransferase subunit A